MSEPEEAKWMKIREAKTHVFDAILRGEKPDSDQYAWALELAESMREKDLITQNAEEFFSSQGSTPAGLTDSHPYPYAAFSERNEIYDRLRSNGINNVAVFGWPWSGRTLTPERERRLEQQYDTADFFVLPKQADFAILQHFFHFLDKSPQVVQKLKTGNEFKRVIFQRADIKEKESKATLEGHQLAESSTDQTQASGLTLCRLNNADNFYAPLLKGMLPESFTPDLSNSEFENFLNTLHNSSHLQFHVSESLEETLSICQHEKQALQKDHPEFNQQQRSSSPQRPPTVIAVASTSDKKEHEVQTLFGDSVRVVRLPSLLGAYVDANEKEGTYAGNAIGEDKDGTTGKAFTSIRHMRDILGEKNRRQEYLENLEQNGISPSDPLFVYVDDRGIEFDRRLENFFDFSGTGNISKPPHQSKPGSVETTYYFKAANGVENFINRVNEGIRKAQKSREPIESISKHPCISSLFSIIPETGELQELYVASGVTQSKLLTEPQGPNPHFRQTDDFTIPNDPRNSEQFSAAEMGFLEYTRVFSPAAQTAEILREQSGIKGSSRITPIRDPKIAHIGAGLTNADSTIPSLPITFEEGSVDEWLNEIDGVIIHDRGDLSRSAFADIFLSLLVSKRLDPHNSGKLLLANRADEEINNLYTYFENVVNLQYSAEFPEKTMPYYNTDKERQEHVELFLSRQPQKALSKGNQRVDDELFDFSTLTNNRPGVFIACSATSNTESDYQAVREAVMDFAGKGYDICYGSGSRFMMGQVLEAKKEWNESHPDNTINVIGVSTNDVLSKETENGKHSDEVTFPHTTRTIHGRIKNFLGNCAFEVALNGGVGTGQEITGFVRTKEENNPIIKGKTAIIIHQDDPPLYHYLLKYYGGGEIERGIKYLAEQDTHVVNDLREAIALVPPANELTARHPLPGKSQPAESLQPTPQAQMTVPQSETVSDESTPLIAGGVGRNKEWLRIAMQKAAKRVWEATACCLDSCSR